jgi:hypothetical protein
MRKPFDLDDDSDATTTSWPAVGELAERQQPRLTPHPALTAL